MPPNAYRRTVTMTVSLAVSFGLLVLISVGVVLGLGLYSATTNTVSLIRDKAELTTTLQVNSIQQHLTPVGKQVREVSKAIAEGVVNPQDREAFGKFLLGSTAGLPQIRALVFVDARYQMTGIERSGDSMRFVAVNYARNKAVRAAAAKTKAFGKAHWGPLIWPQRFTETVLNMRQPVMRDGKYIGMVVALTSIRRLSSQLARLDQTSNSVSFILRGKDHVLAHRHMSRHADIMNAQQPLPRLAAFKDPILRAMWDPNKQEASAIKMRPPLVSRTVEVNGEVYVFIWRQLKGFSERPWIVGSYVSVDYIGEEVMRLVRAGIAGLAALLLAVVVAIFVGRRIARPVKRLSLAAENIGRLDLDNVEELPGSRITELNQQARAFNAMIGGLRWFEHYVPKPLVRRLLEQGESATEPTDDRNLTVMFTDIVGFSELAEGLPASEVAGYLNEHFRILAACVDETGGTVDKFIGDSVMAFWGAPEKLKDRAERACRAARLMQERLSVENDRRRQAGEPTMRIRVGIHSGKATVGNIGAPDRVNYTVVGDMVNVAARMEQLGKELIKEKRDVVVLITDATRQDLSDDFAPRSLGFQQVKGREEEIEVFDLLPPTSAGTRATSAG